MKKILFVPIDNRPITYSLTEQIAEVNKSLKLFMPKREHLGGLIKQADIKNLLDWLKNADDADLIVLSLDTIIYGGLVSSRRCPENLEELKARLSKLKEILKEKKEENKNLKIYATSSIMRISNNNVNEEEKEYWSFWGEKIFKYSYETHKNGFSTVDIPKEILEDYLNTRKRNFEINKCYLEWIKENIIDFMVYSKDDTGEFGLNVQEAENLSCLIKESNLSAIVKTGADEIPLGLLSRGITEDKKIKIKIIYSSPSSTDLISRYEDLSVKNCTEAQIDLGILNAKIVEEDPDIVLYINNFESRQGDLVFQDVINLTSTALPDFNTPYIVADINNANGADNKLVEEIFKKGLSENLLAYSGYNTSANTIGSAICLGVNSYLAKKENSFNEKAFKKVLAIRFLDDWGYQANERIKVQKNIEVFKSIDFSRYEKKIKNFLNFDFKTEYLLPWNRSFEVEIRI